MPREAKRKFQVIFVKEYKWFFNKNYKKSKCDYILNINKIIKEKFDSDIFIMNDKQAFLLNYEIKKLIDKAITITNQKYDKIVYVNNNLNITSILNTMRFMKVSYPNIKFNFILLNKNGEFDDIKQKKEAFGLLVKNCIY